MSKHTLLKSLLALSVLCLSTSAGATWSDRAGALSIDIVADNGQVFRRYNVPGYSKPRTVRAYLEAERGRNYGIRVRNNSGRRVGLVIAVDGRNIISGRKSHLRRNEPMYVLGPYQEATYEGWRTDDQRVHRFYFTDMPDSYAEAWGDRSAMGVIAVAAFREKITYPREQELSKERAESRPSPAEAPSGRLSQEAEDSASQPGTGFGTGVHSPSVRVQFQPEPSPFAKHFYKYEWRDTLVRKGIIREYPPENRFWPEHLGNAGPDGFAPHPPGFWSRHSRD